MIIFLLTGVAVDHIFSNESNFACVKIAFKSAPVNPFVNFVIFFKSKLFVFIDCDLQRVLRIFSLSS